MEKYLTSLEVSKRLKEARVKQESEFFFDPRNEKTRRGFQRYVEDGIEHWFISRYLISELLEMVSNEEIEEYLVRMDGAFVDPKTLFNIIRSPDYLAEVVLWKLGKEAK